MKLLILGGTQFVGRHIVEKAIEAGHRVTVFTRGRTPDELPSFVERLHGDRDDGKPGLEALVSGAWDACIDVSGYTPRQVRASAELLAERANRYLFISAVSVYGDPTVRPVYETHPLSPPASEEVTEIDNETYGPLKVACEGVVQAVFGDRGVILRPQIVAGPYDPSGRFDYWTDRAARGDVMLAPGDGTDHLQFIDARDLARFTVKAVEDDLSGAYNLSGKRITWREFIEALGVKQPAWVSERLNNENGLTYQDLPLYRPERGLKSGLMEISNDRAVSAGLTLTYLETTLEEMKSHSPSAKYSGYLSAEREAELIRNSLKYGITDSDRKNEFELQNR